MVVFCCYYFVSKQFPRFSVRKITVGALGVPFFFFFLSVLFVAVLGLSCSTWDH